MFSPYLEIINNSGYPLSRATEGSAGIDLRVPYDLTLLPYNSYKVDTGIRIHIKDPNIAAIMIPRSGLGGKGVIISNLVGLIDSDYQGGYSLQLTYIPRPIMYNGHKEVAQGPSEYKLEAGDRVAQLVFIPVIHPVWNVVTEFSESSKRGDKGFGHSGTV